MGNKTKTNTTNQYNAASMATYNAFQPQIQSTLTDYAQDPQKSSYFNLRYQQNLNQVQQLGNRGMSNVLMRGRALGGPQGNGMLQSLLAQQTRGNSANEAGAFTNNLLAAEDMRRQAIGQMQAYNPLQTGQSTTQSTSGLGTWLPQVIGIGAAAGLGAMTGGGSMAMGALGGGLKGASGMAGMSGGGQGAYPSPGNNQGGYSNYGYSPFYSNPYQGRQSRSYQSGPGGGTGVPQGYVGI